MTPIWEERISRLSYDGEYEMADVPNEGGDDDDDDNATTILISPHFSN